MSPEDRNAQLAIARTHIQHPDHGGRKPNKFYDAIQQVCEAGASVKLIFRTPAEANKLRLGMNARERRRRLRFSVKGNTLRIEARCLLNDCLRDSRSHVGKPKSVCPDYRIPEHGGRPKIA